VDALDRQIAAALQLHGRATWREVAKLVGSSESTVARRGRQLLETGLVRVTGQPDPLALGLGYPVIVNLECHAGAGKEVARSLAARPDVRFLSIVTGACDIVLELIVPSQRHLAHVLVDEFSQVDGIARTTTDSVLRTFKTSYDWSSDLLEEHGIDPSFGRELRELAIEAGDPAPLDPLDLQLIQLLGEDGRRAYAELAAALGISESMVRRRVSALVRNGYLAFATLVDPEVLGYHVEVLVWLRVDLGELEPIAAALGAHRGVRYLSATSGFSDLLCEVILRSPADLYAFSTGTLGAIEGIRQASVAHELVVVKRAYMEVSAAVWEDAEDDRAAGRRRRERW
jgi:DNA-binding Lrp family transcriptional regulator